MVVFQSINWMILANIQDWQNTFAKYITRFRELGGKGRAWTRSKKSLFRPETKKENHKK